MTDNHPEKILIIVPIFSGAIKFPWGNCPIFLFYFVPMVVGRSQDTILDGRGLIPGKKGGGGGVTILAMFLKLCNILAMLYLFHRKIINSNTVITTILLTTS